MIRTITAFGLFVGLTIVTGSPAFAQQISRTVQYRDLDLTNTSGVKTLNRRVFKAVSHVCRVALPSSPLLTSQNMECRQIAFRSAKPQVGRAIEIAQRRAHESQLAAR